MTSTHPRRRARAAVLALALAILPLGGCATMGQEADANDPLEPINRVVWGVNEGVDILLIRPAADTYRTVVPDPVQRAVRNFLRNLASPIIIANQLLQGDLEGAQTAFTRFVINTTAGIGGLMDVAESSGYPFEYEDFGQTLAVWGVPEGAYLFLPVLGPSSLRDAGGLAVDSLADPINLWAGATDRDAVVVGRGVASGIDTRAQYIGVIDDVRRNSLDPYAQLRSLYRQRRAAEIRDGQGADTEFPEFEDTPGQKR
jgi:phospholipid-binding lipoprotein MlaA